MTAADAPPVFVVDDNAGVRASILGLLKSARLRCTSFGTAEEHPRPQRHEDTEKMRIVSSS
jgi:FixJ family two-component response regulator